MIVALQVPVATAIDPTEARNARDFATMEAKRTRDWLLSSAWYDDPKIHTTHNQPEDRIMGGILVLVLSLSMAMTQDKPVAAAEPYRALLKKSGEAGQANWKATTDEERKQVAARMEPLPLKLLEL